MSIASNLENIKKNIPDSTVIVAATKTRSIPQIQEGIDAGIQIIGENYVQEAEEKYSVLKGKVKFHCIGHLQSNKAKKAAEIFDCIQTVDSVKLAKELDKEAKKLGKTLAVMIEINIANESNKSGCAPDEAPELCKEISKFKNLDLIGLMTLAPYFEDVEKVRPYFKSMKQIFDCLKEDYDLMFLSMGMSDSYKIAIEEGSNMIRPGTVLFGPR